MPRQQHARRLPDVRRVLRPHRHHPRGAAPGGGAQGFGVSLAGIGFGPPPPNCMTIGTRPVALAGVTTVNPMLTVIAGYDELSTRPISCFVITATSLIGCEAPPPNPPPPIGSPVSLLTTSHLTAGMFLGTRPYTSRSKSSLISARRAFHCDAVVTRVPFSITSGSGSSGYGLAVASSYVATWYGSGPAGKPEILSRRICRSWSCWLVRSTTAGWALAAPACAAPTARASPVVPSARTIRPSVHCSDVCSLPDMFLSPSCRARSTKRGVNRRRQW